MSGSSYGGTIGGGNGTASATGPANWQFEWLSDEELPYQVVVRTTVTIQAESWQFGGSQGTVSVSGPSGLAITTTSYPIMGPGFPIGWYTKKVISGTIHTVVDGSAVISVDVPISASATSSTGSMSAQAWSTVTLHPAIVNFGNSVAINDDMPLAPIGGKVIATASVVGLSNQLSSYFWITPGQLPFEAYTVSSGSASSSLTDWTNDELNAENFHFREDGEVIIACQVSLPDIGVIVFARKRLTIDTPEWITTENSISSFKLMQDVTGTDGKKKDTFRLMQQSGGSGRLLGFGVREAQSVILKNNTASEINITQLVKPMIHTIQEVVPGIDHHTYGDNNSIWGLDHKYPYLSDFTELSSLSEAIRLQDSPGVDAAAWAFNKFKLLEVNSLFQAFLMYTPTWSSGSMPVTLAKNEWNCHGRAERANLQSPFVITINTANQGSTAASTEHPIWSIRHISGQ